MGPWPSSGSARPNASASECAGSVESTRVRFPSRAASAAVPAASVVLPTPPLPVNSITRICANPPLLIDAPGPVTTYRLSTRSLSPCNAVLTIIFSAFFRIKPIIGMLNSTMRS